MTKKVLQNILACHANLICATKSHGTQNFAHRCRECRVIFQPENSGTGSVLYLNIYVKHLSRKEHFMWIV